MFGRSNKQFGDEGEQIARDYLQQLGMEIIETNFRSGRTGEIDIVAKEGDVLVFCEVKMRRNDEYGDPEFAITPRKQAQVRRLANAYLYERELEEQECRFDVVAIKKTGVKPEIYYIPNAF